MGLIKEHKTVIDGITYTTTTLDAGMGLVIMPKILAMMGERVAALIFATEGEEEATEELLSDPAVQGKIMAAIADKVAETNGLLVVKDLLSTTVADKVSIGDTEVPGALAQHFDQHFAGRYGHLFRVALWVARVNFLTP